MCWRPRRAYGMSCATHQRKVCDVCWSLLEVLDAMRCVLLRMLEAMEGRLCLLEILHVLEVPEVIRCVLLCMLEAIRCVLLCMLEVVRRVLLCMLETVEGGLPSFEASKFLRRYCGSFLVYSPPS